MIPFVQPVEQSDHQPTDVFSYEKIHALAFLLTSLCIVNGNLHAQQGVALTSTGNLLPFDANTPSAATGAIAITGLAAGESLVGLDYRPFTRLLVGVTNQSRLVTLNPTTGVATALSTLSVPLAGTNFGVDFNPLADRLRIVSNTGQDLRVNVDTGAVTIDGAIAYATTDTNAGVVPLIGGSAYTNSVAGKIATATTLYNIDFGKDVLVRQEPPNNGTLSTVGALGVDFSANTGMDIFSPTLAFASTTSGATSSFYQVSLVTGAATLVGNFPAGNTVVDFSLTPKEAPVGIINTSSRGLIAPGEGVVIVGFVVSGNGPTNVLVTTRGPTLAQFGVSSVLADTKVALYRGATLMDQNDDWQSHSRATEIAASGLAPMNTKEAALLISLTPGAYTAVVSGAGTATNGVALAEVYEMP